MNAAANAPELIEIEPAAFLDRWDHHVIYSGEAASRRDLILAALRERANLAGANLTRADLTRADLAWSAATPVR